MIKGKALSFLPLAAISILMPQLSADARPYLYMSAYEYDGSYSACAANAEKVLRGQGFNDGLKSEKDSESRSAMVYAWHDDESITADIRCYQREGTTVLGVAGIDNEVTWEIYEKLKAADW